MQVISQEKELPRFKKIPDLARASAMKASFWYAKAKKGEIPGAIRFGAAWRIPIDVFERILTEGWSE
jgi:hypothetical protein